MCRGGGNTGHLCSFCSFRWESKTALKNKIYFKNPLKDHSNGVYFRENRPSFCLTAATDSILHHKQFL